MLLYCMSDASLPYAVHGTVQKDLCICETANRGSDSKHCRQLTTLFLLPLLILSTLPLHP
jgi:hypothetical protein